MRGFPFSPGRDRGDLPRRDRFASRLRGAALAVSVSLAGSLGFAGAAQAVVVDMNAVGSGPTVAYSGSNQSGYYGVSIAPAERGTSALATAGVPVVVSSAPCTDPALTADFTLPSTGLCSHGGSVLHANETFAMVWDPRPHSDYASQYVEQYLKDVASASGSLSSPYADTTQYTDAGGRAGNQSLYGGGYDEQTAYPANGCTVSGTHHYYLVGSTYYDRPNDVCLTDAQLTAELQAMVINNGLINRVEPGYSPLLVMLTPPGVETCLDANAHLCSANADNSVLAHFCSYHGQLTVAGTVFNYIVQPWTTQSSCDEPDAAALPTSGAIDPKVLADDMGSRLVSPLSEAQIATIVNPSMNGWFALDGSEVDDNGGCAPIDSGLDTATLGKASYLLQREFNNAGAMVNDPFAIPCVPSVGLLPTFVDPSGVSIGDVVQFDGSKTKSTLLVPNADYVWNFGDGVTAIGNSVVHTYAHPGTYSVTLVVTDRGGNKATYGPQTVVVSGPPTVAPAPTPVPAPSYTLSLQLVPKSLGAMLRSGLTMRVSSSQRADGIITLSISRAAARRAHISAHGASVVIARGTVSKLITHGTVTLHLKLSRQLAAKLARLGHVQLTVRLAVVNASGQHRAVVAAASY